MHYLSQFITLGGCLNTMCDVLFLTYERVGGMGPLSAKQRSPIPRSNLPMSPLSLPRHGRFNFAHRYDIVLGGGHVFWALSVPIVVQVGTEPRWAHRQSDKDNSWLYSGLQGLCVCLCLSCLNRMCDVLFLTILRGWGYGPLSTK